MTISLAQAVFLLITKYNSDSLYHICMLLVWLDHSSNQYLAPWLWTQFTPKDILHARDDTVDLAGQWAQL